jgi:glycosyltransferase involved in cell wall biosynthesis
MTGRRIFWSHPQLRDYRKPLFDLVHHKYKVKFFFQRRDQIPNNFDVIYGKKGIANRGLTIYDIINLYKGIKESDVFISSFLSSYYSIIGIIFAKILNKKVIIWEEISHFFKGFRYSFEYLCLKQIAKWVDAFFVLGKPQQLALKKLGVRAEEIFVANEYPGHIYYKIRGRKINSLNVDKKKVILYLGRLVPFKGINYLLEAYSLLEKKYSDVLLLIVGYGPLERQLKECTNSLEVKNIKFLGPITDINRKKYLFEISNMVIVPSVIDKTGKSGIEGGPIVVVEALSAGTPVLGTNGMISSTKFIRDGINGFVVSHSDSKALFNKMEEILKWENEDKVRKRVIAEFKKIKGHCYQFEKIECAINFCLGRSHEKSMLPDRLLSN